MTTRDILIAVLALAFFGACIRWVFRRPPSCEICGSLDTIELRNKSRLCWRCKADIDRYYGGGRAA